MSHAPMELESFDNTMLDPIADVQGSPDTRNISIDKVGIRELRHPIAIRDKDERVQHTVATFAMYVALPHHVKGTHMSRFVDLLNRTEGPIAVDNFSALLTEMVERLDARTGDIEMEFPFFVRKHAPISGAASLIDYHATLRGHLDPDGVAVTVEVVVPVTSLCPCSKQISDYGAHNQRSHIIVAVRTNQTVWLAELIELVERQASAELYGVLKRADEKYVTEHAYDNPKFVEDVVRDVAAILDADKRIDHYRVSVENFESIHNHSAFAEIVRDKIAG